MMDKCMVCGQMTTECPPSPFLPYSGWRCQECQKAHRIPYEDLLGILYGAGTANSYEERLEEFRQWWRGSDGTGPDDGIKYAEKYWLPTMEFFGKTTEQAFHDAFKHQSIN